MGGPANPTDRVELDMFSLSGRDTRAIP